MPKGNLNNKSLWITLFFVLILIAFSVFRSEEKPEVEFFAPPTEEGVPTDAEVRNEGTEHEFISAEAVKPEAEPNLSQSTISVSAEGTIVSGTIVHYIIYLFNNGNSDATDMDVLNELDISFNLPSALIFDNCGDDPNYNAEEEGIEFSSVTVKQGEHCKITYDAIVKTPYVGDYRLTNNLYISPAAEGGEEVGPIFSDSLNFGSSYEKPIVDPVVEPIADPVVDQAVDPIEELIEEIIEEQVEEPIEEQVEESIEEPAEGGEITEPVEEPAEEELNIDFYS